MKKNCKNQIKTILLIKPILEDHLRNFTDSQYKSLYKTAILFGSLQFNKFVTLKLMINEIKQLFKIKAKASRC